MTTATNIHLNSNWGKKTHSWNVRPIYFDVPHLLLDDEITSDRSNQTHFKNTHNDLTFSLKFMQQERIRKREKEKVTNENLTKCWVNARIFLWKWRHFTEQFQTFYIYFSFSFSKIFIQIAVHINMCLNIRLFVWECLVLCYDLILSAHICLRLNDVG